MEIYDKISITVNFFDPYDMLMFTLILFISLDVILNRIEHIR